MGGVSLGAGSRVCPHCFLGNGNIEIGDGTFINYNVWMNTAARIKIGRNCNIAMRVSFITSTHEIGSVDRRAGQNVSKPITVGNGVWIGANAVILPGVTINDGCIVAAGAVVNRDCEPNSLYAGVPAVKVKSLS